MSQAGTLKATKKSAAGETKTLVGDVLIIKDREEVMENVATDENWKTCFSQLAPGLVLFAKQWTRSAADAEDVVQEAFVKFWRRNHDIANRGLLYATVRSVALDLLRRDSRRAKREATALSDTDQSVQPAFEIEDDEQRALVGAIGDLPSEQREVLVMKIWNDLTFAEIGSALGISQNTAASRYRYALAALKKNFPST
ncbi:MAG TPA: sigma-70 family RNA polymerase sigma factor [Chthoniobacterales bacterium]|nr:sigma-70 family RNA polymerase sigma factor [Chthoniobacterales bacterium]